MELACSPGQGRDSRVRGPAGTSCNDDVWLLLTLFSPALTVAALAPPNALASLTQEPGPPRPPLPKAYVPLESPPTVPPLPSESRFWPYPNSPSWHRSGETARGQVPSTLGFWRVGTGENEAKGQARGQGRALGLFSSLIFPKLSFHWFLPSWTLG